MATDEPALRVGFRRSSRGDDIFVDNHGELVEQLFTIARKAASIDIAYSGLLVPRRRPSGESCLVPGHAKT